MFPSLANLPSNYLVCDGSVYNTSTYGALFAILNVNTVPDLRDQFIRGYDSRTGRAILST